MIRSTLLFLVFFILLSCSAFGDVIGIAAFSQSSAQSSEELLQCVLESFSGVKGHYLKPIEGFQPFNSTVFEKIGREERIDVIYHYYLYQKEDGLILGFTQYHVALKKTTGRATRALGDSLRPCDAAVFLTIDYLDKEPTFKAQSEPYVFQGRELAQQGRFDDAGAYYSQATAICSSCGSIYREMGLFLENGERPYWAMEWYRLAIKYDRHEVESYMRMARIFQELYTYEEGASYLLQTLDRGPKPPAVFVRLGEAYEALGNDELAWQYYEQAYNRDPSNPKTLKQLKRTLLANRQWAKASDYQLRYIQANPNDAQARTELLELYLRAENYKAAIAILEEYIKISPDEPAWVSRLGKAYMGLQDFDKARKYYLRLLELEPGNTIAYLALGQMDYRQKRFAEAKVNLQYALKDSFGHIDALRMLGRIQEWEQDYVGAIETQKKIILYEDELKDGDLLRMFALGRKANMMSLVEADINDILRFKSRAESRKLIMTLAESMVADGRKAEAQRYLQSKMRLLNRHAPAYLLLGNLLVEQGRLEEADQIFISATFATSDSSVPLKVALLYHKLKRFEQAEYFYRFATNRNENSSKILLQYLEVSLINKHLDEALWTIYDIKDRELPPLYEMWLAYLQIMWARLKGDDGYYQGALQYGLKLMEHHGQPKRLDFADFKAFIPANFQGGEQALLIDLTLLFEGKLSLEEFQKEHPGQ